MKKTVHKNFLVVIMLSVYYTYGQFFVFTIPNELIKKTIATNLQMTYRGKPIIIC